MLAKYRDLLMAGKVVIDPYLVEFTMSLYRNIFSQLARDYNMKRRCKQKYRKLVVLGCTTQNGLASTIFSTFRLGAQRWDIT